MEKRLLLRVRRQSVFRNQSGADGQILVLFAIVSVVLIGVIALAIDVGYLLTERRQTQSAVDAASLAGAVALLNGESYATVQATVNSYLADNGIDLSGATVSTQITGAVPDGEVAVQVDRPVQKFFLGAVYAGDWEVGAFARSRVEMGIPKEYALLALDESGDSIKFTGNIDVDIVGGGAMSNGSSKCTGNADFVADTNVDAHDGFTEIGNCEFIGLLGKNGAAPIVPDPLAHVPPPPRPARPGPPGGGSETCSPSNHGTGNGPVLTCPEGQYTSDIRITGNSGHITFTGNSYRFMNGVDVKLTGNNMTAEFGNGSNNVFYFTNGNLQLTGNSPTVTFWPGTYYFGPGGSFDLTGNNPTVIFKPGHYLFYMEESDLKFTGNSLALYPDKNDVQFYFENGDFTATGNTNNTTIPPGVYFFNGGAIKITGNSKVYGDNVFFYLENGARWAVTGNAKFELSASQTPLYSGMEGGMLFYSNRNNTGNYTFTGNASTRFNGVIYLPAVDVTLTGNMNGIWAEGQVIVNTIQVTGNTNLDILFKDYVDIEVPAVWLVE